MDYFKVNVEKPLTFVSGGHFTSAGPWIHSKRCINSFEIIIGVSGSAFIQQDQEQYEVESGCSLLLLPGYTHQGYRTTSHKVSFYWFHFLSPGPYEMVNQLAFEEQASHFKNNPYFHGLDNHVLLPIFFRPPHIDKINILFHQLLHVANSGYYTPQACDYLLTSLLIELSHQALSNFSNPIKENSQRNFEKILEWIRIHADRKISLEDIAHQFGYNKHYLSRLFRSRMGMTIQEYIHMIKISKAKGLLYRSEKSIKEISFELGLMDEKYFMRLFKRYEGVTPTEFRNAYYKTHMNNR